MKISSFKKLILSEAKVDQEAFINKFGQSAFDKFIKLKQRLINNGIKYDITWHVKHTDPEEMDNILYDAENRKVKDAETGKARLNREFIGSSMGYDIYLVKDWQTAMNMGDGTQWCIAGRYDTDGKVKPSQAKNYFNRYDKDNRKQYFLVKNGKTEFCVTVYPEDYPYEIPNAQKNYQLWNVDDEDVSDNYTSKDLPLTLIPGIFGENSSTNYMDNILSIINDYNDKDLTKEVFDQIYSNVSDEELKEFTGIKSWSDSEEPYYAITDKTMSGSLDYASMKKFINRFSDKLSNSDAHEIYDQYVSD